MANLVSQKPKLSKVLPVLTILLGTALMIYMITVEDEPGALPLVLIVIEIVWCIVNRYQIKNNAMKQISIVFLQAVIVLIGMVILAILIWLPLTEGRATNLDLFTIYADKFILYGY